MDRTGPAGSRLQKLSISRLTPYNYVINAIVRTMRAWNSIPADLHSTLNTATFKKNLKTFLFPESYSSF